MIDDKTAFAFISILLTFAAYAPYIYGMYKGTNKPHLFMWLIWTIVVGIVFVAQWSEGAGVGAWVSGLVFVLCFIVSCWTLKAGDKHFTRFDWGILFLTLSAIPLWVLTSDPLWAVCLVSLINSLSFLPTIRKSWGRPFEEHITMYFINVPRHLFTIAALEAYSVTTVLYNASVACMCFLAFCLILYRRHTDGKTKNPA